MKVLIVSTNLSHPTDAGNRAAIMGQVQILKHLGCDVHFLFVDMSLRNTDESAMEDYWGENYHVFRQGKIGKIKRLITDKIRPILCHGHWRCDDHYASGVERLVKELDTKIHFDAIIVQYMRLSKLLTFTEIPQKAIYTHDVFSYKDLRIGGPFYESCDANEEAKAMQRCPNIFAIQEEEATYYRFIAPQSRIYTVYNPYDFHQMPITDNQNILYLASRMDFNVMGILWFLDHVWNKVLETNPNARLLIGGTVCQHIPEGKYPQVELQGFVDSLDSFYKQGNIVINPVSLGTGMKIKTFESLSYGKTTLVHPHSAIGIYNKESAPLVCASEPEEWVKCLSVMLAKDYDHNKNQKAASEYIQDMHAYIARQYSQFLGLS